MKAVPDALKRFKIAGKTVEFFSLDGSVLSNQKWSETHINQSGLGGYVNMTTGYVSVPQITSHVVTKQEIWLRLSNGKDVQCCYTGKTVPVTSGQNISVISMTAPGRDNVNVALVNHSTDGFHFISDVYWIASKYIFKRPSLLLSIFLTIVGWIVLYMTYSFFMMIDGAQLESQINSPPVQKILGQLIQIVPKLQGQDAKGSLAFYLVWAVMSPLAIPPLYFLWRYISRYIRFRVVANKLSFRLKQLGQAMI